MRILVTGGAGFIGSHLTRRLLNDGHQVICVDNLISGSRRNLAFIGENKDFEFIEHDIIEPIRLDVDQVYHLACPASPKFYVEHPIRTAKTNFVGTMNALGIAKRCNAAFLFTSSSEVYGESTVELEDETYTGNVNPTSLEACYREGKRIAETITMDYKRRHGVRARIVRLFHTYGPYMRADDGRAMSRFIVQALLNQDITVYGQGENIRSFMYIDDLIEALVLMMNNKEDECGPINLGHPEYYTMKHIAERILNFIPESKSKIISTPAPDGRAKWRRPDITRARKLLQWEPQVSLDDGIKKTLDYFRDYFKGTL